MNIVDDYPGLLPSLTFDQLRDANEERCTHLRNRNDMISHGSEVVKDWEPNNWMVAVTGEVGELASLLKQFRRGDIDQETLQHSAAHEMADIAIYLDLLAARMGINLGEAVRTKFNLKSEEVGSPVRL